MSAQEDAGSSDKTIVTEVPTDMMGPPANCRVGGGARDGRVAHGGARDG